MRYTIGMFIMALLVFCASTVSAQNQTVKTLKADQIGIGIATPGTALDVAGDITLRETTAAVASDAVTIPDGYSQVQLTGAATGEIAVTPPTAPANAGKHLIIYNNTTGGFGASFAGVIVANGQTMEFVYSNNAWQSVGSAGINALAAPAGSSANGGTIAAGTLTLSLANGTNPGLTSTKRQVFAGKKLFTGGIALPDSKPLAFGATSAVAASANGDELIDTAFVAAPAGIKKSYTLALPDSATYTAAPISNDGTGNLFWGLVIPQWKGSRTYISGSVVYNGGTVYRASVAIPLSTAITDTKWDVLCSSNGASGWTLTDVATTTLWNTPNGGTLADNILFGSSGNVAALSSQVTGVISGILSGSTGLALNGGGELTLTGINTYTGGTAINAGTLTVGNTGKLASGNYTGAITITNGSAFQYNSSANQTLGGIISGAGALTLGTNAGIVTLTAANTYTGATSVNGGKLYIGNGSVATPVISGSTPVSIANGATVRWNNAPANSPIIANAISGAGTLEFYGANAAFNGYSQYSMTGNNSGFTGTVNLNAARYYNGTGATYYPGTGSTININAKGQIFNAIAGGAIASAININDGSGWFDASGALGAIRADQALTISGNVALNQTTAPVSSGQNSTFGTNVNGTNITVNGVVSGSGWLKTDKSAYPTYSTLILNGSNTFTGPIELGLGGSVIRVAGSGNLGNGTYAGNIVNAGDFQYYSSATQTLSGVISGAGKVTKDIGTGTLTLTGNETYSGLTTSNAGTLSLQGTGNTLTGAITIGASGAIDVDNAGVLHTGIYAAAVTNNGNLTWNSSANSTISSVIGGTGNLTLNNSSSTLQLTGLSTYTGATNVTAGKLYLNNGKLGGGATGSKTITISSGAILECGGTVGTIDQLRYDNLTTLNIDGTLQIDNTVRESLHGQTINMNNGTILLPTTSTANTWSDYGSLCAGANAASTTFNATGANNVIGGGADGSTVVPKAIAFGNASATIFKPTNIGDVLTINGQLMNISTFVGALAKQGAGKLVLNGANTYTGATTISDGTVLCGSTSALGVTSAVTNNATLDMNGKSLTLGSLAGASTSALITNSAATDVTLALGTSGTTYAGVIEDGSAKTTLTTSGSSTLYLTGANTYTGNTTIGSGTILYLGNGGATGSIFNGVCTPTLTLNGTFVYNNTTGAAMGNLFAGTGGLSVGKGTLELTCASNTLTTNTLGIASGAGLTVGGSTGTGVLNTNATGYTGAITDNGLLKWNSSQSATLSGVISGSGALTLDNSSATLTLKGANTYSGATTVTAGKLYIGDGTTNTPTIGSGAMSIANGATVRWNKVPSTSATIANAFSGAGTLEFYGNNAAYNTYSSYLVTGNNSGFTGTLNLNGARMSINTGSNAFPGAGSTININATGQILSNIAGGTIASNININDGAGWLETFTAVNTGLGAIRTEQNLTINGNVTLNQTTTPVSTGQNSTFGTAVNGTVITVNGVVSGSGWLKTDKNGNGYYSTVILNGTNTFSGPIELGKSGSILEIGGSGSLGSGSYAGNIVNAGIFRYNSSADQTLSGVISGSGGYVTKNTGTGTLTLTGNNTYGGTTTVNAGTLSFQGTGNTLTGAFIIAPSSTISVDEAGVLHTGIYAAAVTNNGNLNWNSSANSTIGSVISGTGNLTLDNPGSTLQLTGTSTYTGATNVTAGTLYLNNGRIGGNAVGSKTITISSGATLEFGGTVGTGDQLRYDNLTTLNIAGTLQIDNTVRESFHGQTINMNNGTVLLPTSSTALNVSLYGSMTIGGNAVSTTFNATGANNVIGGGADGSTVAPKAIGMGSTSATIFKPTNIGDVLTINGEIMNSNALAGALTKQGAGKLVLNGTNTYTGVTTVSAGTMVVNGSLANTATTVSNGGALGGTGTSSGSCTVASGGIIFGGTGPGNSGTLSMNAALTMSAAGSILNVYSNGTAGSCSKVSCASNLVATNGITVNFADEVPAGTYQVLFVSGTKTLGTVTVNPPSGLTVASKGWNGITYEIVLN